jgi:hypothetical protein
MKLRESKVLVRTDVQVLEEVERRQIIAVAG